MQDKINFALIGCGYWGSNFIRVIQNSRSAFLSKVCDADKGKLDRFVGKYEHIMFTADIDQIITDDKIEGVLICTPVESHFALTKKMLLAGKHVLCEKPLAHTVAQCEELGAIATAVGRKLLVGHVFEYNAVIRHMKSLILDNQIGDVRYLDFSRVGLGPVRKDVSVVFDLASHDISIAISLMGQVPISVMANGSIFLQKGIEDVAFIQLEFAGNIFANISVSWIDPMKQRMVKVVGSKGMLLFDDVSVTEKLKIIEMGKDYQVSSGDFGSYQLSTKDGIIVVPNLPHPEPLMVEFNHFIDCIRDSSKQPFTGAEHATKVVRVLETAQLSILNEGAKIKL